MFRYLFNSKRIAIAVLTTIVIASIITAILIMGSGENMSEIDKTANAQRNVFIIYILSLAVTVFLSVIVWITSNRYQEAIKSDADVRIETAKASAEVAKAEAVKANENIADLKVKGEEAIAKQKEFEKQNLILRSDLTKSSGDLAKLQIRAAEAERSLLELQERQKSRHLTDEQRLQLIDLLSRSPKGDIAIGCIEISQETLNFGQEIYNALKTAGWRVQGVNTMLASGFSFSGLRITVKTQNSPSSHLAGILQRALKEVGMEVPASLDNSLPENQIVLMVGSKP